MKKHYLGRRLGAVLLALVFCGSILGAASAAPGGGDSQVTLVETRSGASFTLSGDGDNLFQNFEGVLPGDTLSQTITVAADRGNDHSFYIYLYARECTTVGDAEHPAASGASSVVSAADFLDYLNITVDAAGKDLGDGTHLGTGTGKSGVLLGTFAAGDSLALNVDLKVDLQMGNDFQKAAAYIDWVFYAEQVPDPDPEPGPDDDDDDDDDPRPTPTPTPTPTVNIPDEPVPQGPSEEDVDIEDHPDVPQSDLPPTEEEIVDEGVPMGDMPQTGDDSGLYLWMALAAVSGCGLVYLLVTGRRKEEQDS